MEWLVLGGLGAGSGLFTYNRNNFIFDGKMQLEREYQGQCMRIEQFGLYREDIRDLVELTVSKMDIYLIINTILLSIAVILFTEGKPKPDQGWPTRTIWLYSLCNIGAILYFLLSAWLAMHASIAAHSFGVRMLTQFVRLPVPNRAQLDAARAQARDYETKPTRDFFRIPIMKQQLERLRNFLDDDMQERQPQASARYTHCPQCNKEFTAPNPPNGICDCGRHVADRRLPQTQQATADPEHKATSAQVYLDHVKIYRELQANWIGFDAYARVCMMMGANQFVHALAYYCLGVFIIENHSPLVGFSAAMAFLVATWLIVKLDIYVSSRRLTIAFVIFLIAPILEMLSLTITILDHSRTLEILAHIMMPIIFAVHIVWIVFILYISKAEDSHGVALPFNFRSVTYLDVYGWTAPTLVSPSSSANISPILSPRANPENDPSFILERVSEEGDDTYVLTEEYQEVDDGQSRTMQPRPSYGYPNEVRRALLGECQRFSARLSCDIGRWESEAVAGLLGSADRERVAEIRSRFNAVNDDLQSEAQSGTREAAESSNDEQLSGQVWLLLDLGGAGSQVYYCVETEQSDFDRPPELERLSEIPTLHEQVELWAKHVRALRDSPLEATRQPHPALVRTHSDSSNTPALSMRSRQDARRDTNDEISSTSSHYSVTQPIRQFEPHVEGDQGTRFAGLESVQLATQGEMRDQFMNGGTFLVGPAQQPHVHPNSRIRGTRERPRRPPGQVPYRTFLQGSIVLLFIWSIGLVWNIFAAYSLDIPVVHPNGTNTSDRPEHLPNGALQLADFGPLDVAFVGEWPHPFFKPTGLACHPDAGQRVFIAERYGVHELDIQRYPIESRQMRPALVGCLAAHPAFHASGIDDISIQCGSSDDGVSRCNALVFSAGQPNVLRCPLDERMGRGEPLVLPGPHVWRALAAGFQPNSFWGLTSKGIVELGMQQSNNIQELVPLSIADVDSSASKLHVVTNSEKDVSSLITMDGSGFMHIWPLQGGDQGGPTILTRNTLQNMRWHGLCSTSHELFSIGEGRTEHPQLLRRPLQDISQLEV